jgi:hypothetical protein
MSGVDADAVLPTEVVGSALIRWRKLLLLRRQELSFVSTSFAKLWKQCFPWHDLITLQLIRPTQSKAESSWKCESWKKAALWYHEQRRGRTLLGEQGPKHVARLRRLLSNDVSLDAAWRELNATENRPTPQVTVEAIWHSVRERGLDALKEPTTRERLARCDAAALAEIDRRITKYKERASAIRKAD